MCMYCCSAKTKLKKWKQEREESRVVGSAEKTKHKTSTSRKLTKDSTPEDKKKKRSKGKSSKHHSDEPSSMVSLITFNAVCHNLH